MVVECPFPRLVLAWFDIFVETPLVVNHSAHQLVLKDHEMMQDCSNQVSHLCSLQQSKETLGTELNRLSTDHPDYLKTINNHN